MKKSTSDHESDWFRKCEHKEILPIVHKLSIINKHRWILGYTAHPGNLNYSRMFVSLFRNFEGAFPLEKLIIDTGYKTPAIAPLLLE